MTIEIVGESKESRRRASFGGRWTYGILIVAFLFVLMPFLFWNATWFGRPMNDAQIAKALADRSHPREIQHALAQLETRIEARDSTVKKWYPQIAALASDPVDEIRVTDAWVMGQDNASEEFHRALLQMLKDPNVMVQRNAALSLVRFNDDSGHPQILAMLRPYEMESPLTGTLDTRLKTGDIVNPGTMIAHIEAGGKKNEVRAAVPGTLIRWLAGDHANIAAGQPLVALAPSEGMVWEALRALYIIGRSEDLSEVEQVARAAYGSSPQIGQQAQSTARAIRDRSAS
jgi:biotin carboxyl carrier protein